MKHKYIFSILPVLSILIACQSELKQKADHYLEHRDYKSLSKVVELIDIPTDTTTIIRLLGQPISTGIDIRYFADSVGPNGCTVGAAFTLDVNGVVTNKWIGELCE